MKITDTIAEAIKGKTIELTIQDCISINTLNSEIKQSIAPTQPKTFNSISREELLRKCSIFFDQLTKDVTSLEDSYNQLFKIEIKS